MSEFIEKLVKSSKPTPQPMGFRTALAAVEKPKMQLVANLTEVTPEGLADCAKWADGVILNIAKVSDLRNLEKARQYSEKTIYGGWLNDCSKDCINKTYKAGFDFVVSTANSIPAAVLQNKELGRILEADASLGDSLLRTIDDLGIDGVLITLEQGLTPLNYGHLMSLRRFANFSSKPLLISAPVDLERDELQALWETGINGLLISAEETPEILLGLRKVVDTLELPKRKKTKAQPTVPCISPEAAKPAEEEEEEEQE